MKNDARDTLELALSVLRTACDEARSGVAAEPDNPEKADTLAAAIQATLIQSALMPPKRGRAIADAVAEAARLLEENKDEDAELLLRNYLTRVRNEPDAMLLMASIASRCGFAENAERILRRSVALHSDRAQNWVALARTLHDRATNEDRVELVDDALGALENALAIEHDHEEALGLKAAFLVRLKRLDEAQRAFENLVALYPEVASSWMNFAHLLKTRGSFGQAVAAYRTAAMLDPANGTIWWLLADLKLARFFPADIARMQAARATSQDDQSMINLHFAMAAAFDQARDYGSAAEHLRLGNQLRLSQRPHDIDAMRAGVDAAIGVYKAPFFAARARAGEPSSAPIFIVGLPRSGSTLVEQILSSHSAIEGTAELFAVQQIEIDLFRQYGVSTMEAIVAGLDDEALARLGARYIDLTKFHRRSGRPRFIDKNPGNWRQIGFIHAMLPNAKIIDIRRSPLDCCFANYTQHFAVGVNYSYGFGEIAAQYREYLRFMRHLDAEIPRRIHHVMYEDVVQDLEGQVRSMFDYLDLPFEAATLRFFENARPVHTPSSEQVRKPINQAGIGKWKNYKPWIGDLESALGEIRNDWRD